MSKRKRKNRVRVTRLNWDVEYVHDILTDNGFTITEPAVVKFDDTKQKSLYGARSPLYGTNYEDENAFIERYRCECGAFKGKMFVGEICPICGNEYTEHPAILRRDNITEICPACGTKEALGAFFESRNK